MKLVRIEVVILARVPEIRHGTSDAEGYAHGIVENVIDLAMWPHLTVEWKNITVEAVDAEV